jgi:pyroglutamyl-peptidase
MATALITGFEGYGGRGRNPSGETALALNGRTIAGVRVAGRRLPVSFSRLAAGFAGLFDEVEPDIVISVGLWPGEPMIRFERIGINVADFEIPDNEGTVRSDEPLSASGSVAMLATLPNREIRDALLLAGIPARISATAGTFLCNAALYTTLSLAARKRRPPLTGFVHVPYLPRRYGIDGLGDDGAGIGDSRRDRGQASNVTRGDESHRRERHHPAPDLHL